MRNVVIKEGDPARLSLSLNLSDGKSEYSIRLSHDFNVSCVPVLAVKRVSPQAEKTFSKPKMAHGATLSPEDARDPAIRLAGFMYGAGVPASFKPGTQFLPVRKNLIPKLAEIAEQLLAG